MSRTFWKRAVTSAVVGGVALATVAAVTITTTVPQAVSRVQVELTATITPGSATNWNADGIDSFYGMDWNAHYGDTVIAPFRLVQFWQGPLNILDILDILDALDAAQTDGEDDVVVSSGRGAGNAGAAITYLAATAPDDPRLTDSLWILDNNVVRPNGGYVAIGRVNPVPVRNDLESVQILDVGYEYAWNSSAPTYISNLPALLKAIIAYAYRYRRQDRLPVPGEILDPLTGTLVEGASGHYVVGTDGRIVDHRPTPAGVTTVYVTYEADGLPMLRPVRDVGGDVGNAFADVVEPALTVLVNASYTDNDPLSDPSVYTPVQLFAPPKVWATAAQPLPGALTEGWQKLREHLGGAAGDQPTTPAADTSEAEASEATASEVTASEVTQRQRADEPDEEAAERDAEKAERHTNRKSRTESVKNEESTSAAGIEDDGAEATDADAPDGNADAGDDTDPPGDDNDGSE